MVDLSDRPDLAIIADWIKPHSQVLDLGCGDGTLLGYLAHQKQANGYGLEREDEYIAQCITAEINIIQMDLDQGLAEFDDNSFDYVVLSLTLQAMRHPEKLLEDMLRVGREGIVTFPNFGHWRARIQLGIFGSMPFTKTLPHSWYDTPNIHLCTLKDFEALCRHLNIRILEHQAVDHQHRSSIGPKLFPNLLGEIALYRFERG